MVKIDRNGLQFFWKHVLERDWPWVNIAKTPKVRPPPDLLTVSEVEQLIGDTRHLRYRVFLPVSYSMGLRLSETLALLGHRSPTTTARYAHQTDTTEQISRATESASCFIIPPLEFIYNFCNYP